MIKSILYSRSKPSRATQSVSYIPRMAALILLLAIPKALFAQQPTSPGVPSTTASKTKVKGFHIGMSFDEAVKAANEVVRDMGNGASSVIDKEKNVIYVGRKTQIFNNIFEVGPSNSFICALIDPKTQAVNNLQFTKEAFNARDTPTNVFVSNLIVAYDLPKLAPIVVTNPVTNQPATAYEGISEMGFKIFVGPDGLFELRASEYKKPAFD
jgi:hypothetical protein